MNVSSGVEAGSVGDGVIAQANLEHVPREVSRKPVPPRFDVGEGDVDGQGRTDGRLACRRAQPGATGQDVARIAVDADGVAVLVADP